jgi:hypothetical protein
MNLLSWPSLQQYGLSTSDISSLKFLKNGGLIRLDAQTNPLSYNQWFGSAVVRPDQVRGGNEVKATASQVIDLVC